ncbi:MAG: AraC family transcriptional regulator [Oscillospiraceae bacterium]
MLGEQTWINSLATFGHATNNKAELPLINHYHKDKLEFVIVVDGIQRYTASDVSYTLYGGDVFFTLPNEIHSSGQNPQSVNEILWFQIDVATTNSFLDLPEREAIHLYNRLINFSARQFPLSRRFINLFLESFELLSNNNVSDKIKGHSLFIYCLVSMLESEATVQTLTEDIDAAKQYILTHIKEMIDMDELLGVSGLSVSRFKEKFKEQIGLSPREFINSTKIEKAKVKVALTKESITDIAFEYSFSSSNYFCVVFKQFTGYSPKEFRRKYLKGKLSLN